MISNKKPIQDLLALLEAKGVHDIILSPGSRNAPLSISLHNHPVLKTHVVVDERSAAFVALGMSQQLRKPVAVICTSGTAALNYSPAIAEAFYQRVPLLVLTADRPVEWIDQGEGQSIRQRDVYSNFVKGSFELMEESTHADSAWYNNRIIDEAIGLCTQGVAGPVHINIPLRESLYGVVEKPTHPVKVVERVTTPSHLPNDKLEALTQELSRASKVMILAGQYLPTPELSDALIEWTKLPQVAVMTEAHSNVADETFVTTIDRLIMGFDEEQKSFFLPEIVITFGHNLISRKIKEYLRKGECQHWHIDLSGEGLDTIKHLNKIIALLPEDFFAAVHPQPNSSSHYASHLMQWNNEKKQLGKVFLNDAPWSDLSAINAIYARIPADTDLQMGNSSVVRYILLEEARADVRHFGNRGVAGIDGCTSTAIGAAFASGRTTTLISGDIAFFYDVNAFWNGLNKSNLKVVVINNGGGGIFRIIEGPSSSPALEDYFETSHQRDASSVAMMYGLAYRAVNSSEEIADAMTWLYGQNDCAILEVFTPQLENDKVLKQFFAAIKK